MLILRCRGGVSGSAEDMIELARYTVPVDGGRVSSRCWGCCIGAVRDTQYGEVFLTDRNR